MLGLYLILYIYLCFPLSRYILWVVCLNWTK